MALWTVWTCLVESRLLSQEGPDPWPSSVGINYQLITPTTAGSHGSLGLVAMRLHALIVQETLLSWGCLPACVMVTVGTGHTKVAGPMDAINQSYKTAYFVCSCFHACCCSLLSQGYFILLVYLRCCCCYYIWLLSFIQYILLYLGLFLLALIVMLLLITKSCYWCKKKKINK